jgi:hypothetical protein
MGFFSLLETFFFISLAITFVLIIMLVYHFKGRLVAIEDRYHTMFEIVNSLVKEMKNMQHMLKNTQGEPIERTSIPPEIFRLFQSGPGMFPTSNIIYEDRCADDNMDDYDDAEDDAEDDEEYKRIVVSDTEMDSDDEAVDDVKVITLSSESLSLEEFEEPIEIDMTMTEDAEDAEEAEDAENHIDIDITPEDEPVVEDSTTEPMDYRKLDVSYLKTMVLTRGLATETK